jgi:hypothetical protein
MSGFYQQNSFVRYALIALWLALVIPIAYVIRYQDKFFAKQVPTVAEVISPKGDVGFRSDKKIRWETAANGTALVDGDRIAAGKKSEALVRFNDGRELSIGEDSQIVISTASHADSGVTYLVNLVKGTVVADAKKSCENCRDIVVSSGSESFKVKNGEKEGYFRDIVERKIITFDTKGPPPVRLATVTPAQVEEIEPQSLPIVVIPKKEVKKEQPISLAGFEFVARAPIEGSSLWTHKSLIALSDAALQIPVSPPAKTPPFERYVPIIEISNLEGTKTDVLAAGSKLENYFSLSLTKIRMLASQRWTGVKHYSFSVRGGIRVFEKSKTIDKLSDAKLTITINSIGELAATPIMLAFDKLNYQSPQGNWIAPKTITPAGLGAIQVTLFTSSDFGKMIPFAVGATQYGTVASSQHTFSVANIVRDGFIVAQITKYNSIEDIRTILKTLGGTFAFLGSKNSFQYSAGNSQDNVAAIVDELLGKQKVLYFFKNEKLYPVNRTFIKNSAEVADFLGKQANIFFTEKVEIIVR